ncbi:hypothetical protein THASP1DRAFT_33795 [Thamnocephalis sphaerospora]|uniref:Uncharacterized protein n=1 Tax=Thamnocephalis sphaerospora TaxID=78915 RepID=A0A4P9XGR6_9FUNG|nr:hypothetical protein THASP1DRAFT_33795 [Thamnocephalis sphaerospora]|eukprot:RKP04441.1 hypothetical protein THASP1DRAFT_33795 [Thamnocephalis sphaerospora]
MARGMAAPKKKKHQLFFFMSSRKSPARPKARPTPSATPANCVIASRQELFGDDEAASSAHTADPDLLAAFEARLSGLVSLSNDETLAPSRKRRASAAEHTADAATAGCHAFPLFAGGVQSVSLVSNVDAVPPPTVERDVEFEQVSADGQTPGLGIEHLLMLYTGNIVPQH